jgi:hypothetical protein
VIVTKVVMAAIAITAIVRVASRAIATETVAAAANRGAISRLRKRVATRMASSGKNVSRVNSTPLKVVATKALALNSRRVSSSLSRHPRNLVRKARVRKAPRQRRKVMLNNVRTKANVASAVNAAVVADEAVVVAVVVAVVTMPVVAKVRAAARLATAPTNLASHRAAIQARVLLLRADRNRSTTPNRVKVTRASPLRLRPRRNLANPRLRVRGNPAAEISSRCGPQLPARAAAHGDRAVRHVARSKK